MFGRMDPNLYPNFIITRKDVFIGSNSFDDLINFLILLAKYVIYRSRCASKIPNLIYYKNCVLSYKTLEKYVAKVNKRSDEF